MKVWEILKEENVGKRYEVKVKGKTGDSEICEVIHAAGTVQIIDMNDEDLFEKYHAYFVINELEFKEVIDWSKVPVDTKILVRHHEYDSWKRRHFAGFKNGKVYAWEDGTTSFTAPYKGLEDIGWTQAKLYDGE